MKAKLNNINLIVRDVEQSKGFYTEVLGLSDTPRSHPPDFAVLEAGGVTLSLQQASRMGENPEPGNVELSFEVENVAATLQKLREVKAQGVSEPKTEPFGSMFDARDPDGYRLNFYALANR
ncbi:MAG: VOC family protein [Thermaceae bacterium]|nr:VOC family protein [Thermaceae bacterium]